MVLRLTRISQRKMLELWRWASKASRRLTVSKRLLSRPSWALPIYSKLQSSTWVTYRSKNQILLKWFKVRHLTILHQLAWVVFNTRIHDSILITVPWNQNQALALKYLMKFQKQHLTQSCWRWQQLMTWARHCYEKTSNLKLLNMDTASTLRRWPWVPHSSTFVLYVTAWAVLSGDI